MKFRKMTAAALAAVLAASSTAVVAFAGEDTINRVFVKDGVEYTEYKNSAAGNLTVTAITNGAPAELVIPSEVEGSNVESIHLRGDDYIISSNKPDYTKLTSISIPESVTYINGLSICRNLSEIILNGENPNYTMVDGVLYNKDITELVAYPNASPNKSYTIPQSIDFKGSLDVIRSLNQCRYLTEIKANGYRSENGALISADSRLVAVAGGVTGGTYSIPDGVKEIGEFAFKDCVNLKSVSIPNSVNKINNGAFMGCTSLSSVNIPAAVDEICRFAFANTSLTELRLSMSADIDDNVFGVGGEGNPVCDKLTSLTLPKKFGAGAYTFAGLNNLTDVYYGGSEDDWKRTGLIDFGDSVTMHYNYQIPNYYVDDTNGIIEVSAELPEEVKFEAKPIRELTNDTQFAYELSFTNSEGEEVQPKGKVTTKVYKIIPEEIREKYYQKYLHIYNVVDEEYVSVEQTKAFRYYFSKGDYENGTFITDNAGILIFSTIELESDPATSTPAVSEPTTSKPAESTVTPGGTEPGGTEKAQEILDVTLKNVDSKNGIEGEALDKLLFGDSDWTWDQVEKVEFYSDDLFSVQFSIDNGGWRKLGEEIAARADDDSIWNTAWTLNTSEMAKDKKYAKVIAKDGIIDVNAKVYIKSGAEKPSGGNSGSDQQPTGIALAIAPVVLAASAAIVVFKKKK